MHAQFSNHTANAVARRLAPMQAPNLPAQKRPARRDASATTHSALFAIMAHAFHRNRAQNLKM